MCGTRWKSGTVAPLGPGRSARKSGTPRRRALPDRDARSRGGSHAPTARSRPVLRRRVRRLLLVRHAPTRATRATAFPLDEPLDDAGRRAAAELRAALPRRCEVLARPAGGCRETADAAGLDPDLDEALVECDFGDWVGRRLADVEPDGARAWMLD